MMNIISNLGNDLAIESALEELQEQAENFAHAIDDMKSMNIDNESWEFLDKLWNGCMEICDRDTAITISEDARSQDVVTYTVEDLMQMLHLGKKQAEALLRTESFPSIKIGRSWIIEAETFRNWLADTKEIKLDYSRV